MQKFEIVDNTIDVVKRIVDKKVQLKQKYPMGNLLDSEKAKEYNTLFHKLDKDSLDKSRLFLGCFEIWKNIDDLDVKEYLETFEGFDNLGRWIENYDNETINSPVELLRIQDLVSKNGDKMMRLVFLANEVFGIFQSNIEDYDDLGGLEYADDAVDSEELADL